MTVRVRGMDVPADKARPVVNAQFQRAAGGSRVAPGMSPDKFAERHYIETHGPHASPCLWQQCGRGATDYPWTEITADP